jgi:Ca-activated chloride channel homolog
MRTQPSIVVVVLLSSAALFANCEAQAPPDVDQKSNFTLSLAVNEVSLNFHVSDERGLPIADLNGQDLQLFDNGKAQARIVELRAYRDLPIRAGLLLDTSTSMLDQVAQEREIALAYLGRFFRRDTDKMFSLGFEGTTRFTRDWTSDPKVISDSVASNKIGENSIGDGTAIYDALYGACRNKFLPDFGTVTGNFILLFTDGVDNASHVRLAEAINMCQRARTAVYVFIPQWKSRGSRRQQTLEQLVALSGGRIFYKPNEEQMMQDLKTIDSDTRSQYRMVYKATNLKRDGSFHRIRLLCSVKGSEVLARSGYYAVDLP